MTARPVILILSKQGVWNKVDLPTKHSLKISWFDFFVRLHILNFLGIELSLYSLLYSTHTSFSITSSRAQEKSCHPRIHYGDELGELLLTHFQHLNVTTVAKI